MTAFERPLRFSVIIGLLVVLATPSFTQNSYTSRTNTPFVAADNGSLLLIRGRSPSGPDLSLSDRELFDVWRLDRQAGWTLLGEVDSQGSTIMAPGVVGLNESLWMTGNYVFRPVGRFMGFDLNPYLLRSEDGLSWTVSSEIPNGDGIQFFGSFEDGLLLVRGVAEPAAVTDLSGFTITGAWLSADGREWHELSTEDRGAFRMDQVGDRFVGVTNGYRAYEYDRRRRAIYPVPMSPEPFEHKRFWEMVRFNGSLYVLGGSIRYPAANLGFPASGLANEVWRSDDNGRTWTMITDVNAGSDAAHHNPPFSYGSSFYPRTGHSVAVFEDHLYVVAGAGGTPLSSRTLYYQDVWRSPDGVQWEKVMGEDYKVLIEDLIERYPAEPPPGG